MFRFNSLIALCLFLVVVVHVVTGDTHDCDCSNCLGSTPDCGGSAGSSDECANCCAAGHCGSYTWTQTSPCFHETSIITYQGQEYTLSDFLAKKQAECRVPHLPSSRGVIITTACHDSNGNSNRSSSQRVIRVTDNHLLATTTGYQTAASFQVGDVLFGNMEGTEECVVQSVEKEKTTQTYFGLNCLTSEVLVDGIKASTFGDFHTLPSWYMYYAGNVLGVDRASEIGDTLATWYFRSQNQAKRLQANIVSWTSNFFAFTATVSTV